MIVPMCFLHKALPTLFSLLLSGYPYPMAPHRTPQTKSVCFLCLYSGTILECGAYVIFKQSRSSTNDTTKEEKMDQHYLYI